MNERFRMKWRNVLLVAALPSDLSPTAAQDQPIRLFASNGIKAVIQAFQPECERVLGRPLAIEFDTSAALSQDVSSGKAFDLIILTSDAIERLAKDGRIAPGSLTTIARSGIGLGIFSGSPKPDVSTPAKLKTELRSVNSITYSNTGASRAAIEKTFEGLGISDEVRSKVVFPHGSESAADEVAKRKVDLVITLISEILPTRGLELVGPLPPEFQSYVNFGAGVSSHATQVGPAKALIQLLKTSAAARVFKAKGMEVY